MASIFDWSLTAANNANADSSVNWQEGQLPSSVNDSARAMMTRVAQLLKDIGGTVTAGGTANAITVTANSPFSAHATGEIIGFKAAATNTGATTLNVNAIGAKSIRKATMAADTALSGGEIVTGGVYILIYDSALNSAAGGWLLINPASATDAFVSLASAATTDLSTVGSQNVTVTGTTTITAFGTAPAGTFRRLRFSGVLTVTYNATSLILPGAVNITTAAGDTLEAVSLGSGNWVVTSYQSALPIFTKQFDSAQQTITSGGAITVAHGFGALPKLIQILLICTTADAGYSIGDVVPVAFNGPANNNNSVGATYDTTNINLRYGSNASVFSYPNKTTGASTALVNGSWRMIVRAWA